MEEILKKLNYIPTAQNEQANQTQLLMVTNPDGTPRWVCSAKATKPLFLKFYTVNNLRSASFAWAIKLIFFLKLQNIIFKTITVYVEPTNEPLINIFDNNWALFTGTVGPNNKLLLYKEEPTGSSFLKIATTAQSQVLINNERNTIKKLKKLELSAFRFPNILNENENCITLEDVSKNATRSNRLYQTHIDALSEIYEKTSLLTNLETAQCFKSLPQQLSALESQGESRIPKGLLRKLTILLDTIAQKDTIEVALCHGDFTPWNVYNVGNKLAIYDWELSSDEMPVGFDAFHYIIQKGIMIDLKPWKEIRKEIDESIRPEVFAQWSESDNAIEEYLNLYLAINTIHYLTIYAHQKKWHPQVYWLLNTWNEAISDQLKDQKCHRELLIMDVFDFLAPKNYAAIKMTNAAPETLSETSDIDLCIYQKDLNDIRNYINHHPLVRYTQNTNLSFMDTFQITLQNDKFLSLDLIWKLKRKNITMLQANEALLTATQNDFGVKIMNAINTARFVGLFYGLNNKEIPLKYQHYGEAFSIEQSKLDSILYDNYHYNAIQREALKKTLMQNSENKGFNYYVNTLEYMMDSLKQLLFKKGLIITFSGVDGAGKSTIIEKTKVEIEKKLRKRVVVIRHRPSLLPILSAWTKGKAQAEAAAAATLPRQGKNTNKLSSLLRFAYYYSDYLFGQFYILFKYKYRGYVVLYDRYYFDFMIDSRRSNIHLSDWVAKIAYQFIITPDLNFFLFADADVILKRKQELTAATIEELTAKYTDLFNELENEADNESSKNYFIIKNIDINATVAQIMNQATLKAA